MSAAVFSASFAALYAGHMVGDYVAQTHRQSLGKGTPAGWVKPMAGHLASYGACQVLALAALLVVGVHMPVWAAAAGVAFSLATHGFIDRRWPVRWLLEHTGSKPFAELASHGMNGMHLADQALHIGCLFISALIIGGLS